MAAINVTAFILGLVFIAVWFDRSPIEVLPLLWSVLAALLYGLCYARCLSAIDYCSVVLTLILGIGLFQARRIIPDWWKKNGSIQQILLLASVAALCLAANWHLNVTHEDDMRYWATSVYSLYTRNGLEVLNANVSRAYGDYPLGMQLLEWWFMHVFSSGWQDRWLFIAYELLVFSFVLPIFRHVKGKWYTIPACILTGLLLTSFSYYYYDYLPPDAFMGVVYGNCLLCAIRARNGENQRYFQEASIAAQLYMLAMTKSIGIFWAVLAFLFYMLLMAKDSRQKTGIRNNARLLLQGTAMLLPALVGYGIWNYTCKVLERTTYLTQQLQSVELFWNEDRLQLVWDYFYTLLAVPSFGRLFDTPFLVQLLVFGFVFYVLYKVWNKYRDVLYLIGIFLFGTTLIYLLILLFSLLAMFWREEPSHASILYMVLRYCAPALTALVFVPVELMINKCNQIQRDKHSKILVGTAILALLLSVNYDTLTSFLCPCLSGVKSFNTQEEIDYYSDVLQGLNQMEKNYEALLLYCDEDYSDWSHNVSLNWILRDVAVLPTTDTEYGIVWWNIETSPATHLYVKGPANGRIGLGEYEVEIEFNTMYAIERTDERVFLTKMESR